MLTRFSVENYRAFVERTEIELRPLTLLFGYNNAGKSALVRALALVADSTRADAGMPLDLSSKAARECTFDELRSNVGEGDTIKIGLSFDEGTVAEVHVAQPVGTFEQVVTELRVELADSAGPQRWLLQRMPCRLSAHGQYICTLNGSEGWATTIDFRGLVPDGKADAPHGKERHRAALLALASALRTVGRDVRWLGPVLRCPPRVELYGSGGGKARVNHDGSGVADILANDKLTGGVLLRKVSRWYERSFGQRLDVVQSQDDCVSITLAPSIAGTGRQVNIADTGEGIAHVLPILVSAAMAGNSENPPILAFEKPELHLHPAVHAPLADYLCAVAAGDRAPRMLIETHSENFLLGVQIQIVKKQLTPDRVLLYWVRQLGDGTSHAERIEFDDEGYPRGFPENVFNEDIELARILHDLRERAVRRREDAL